MEKEITLIVNTADRKTDVRDEAELHGLFPGKQKVTRKLSEIGENLNECMEQVQELLNQLRQKTIESWELDGVTVGFAISAEGSIGVATAGVEASLEVTFKPKANQSLG
jgi:hypothetical protein